MFCSHCGKALPEGAKFCVHCGNPAQSSGSDAPCSDPSRLQNESSENRLPPSAEEQTSAQSRCSDTPEGSGISTAEANSSSQLPSDMEKIIGKNSAYYLEQFAQISRDNTCRFNWAACLLGLCHAAYRGVWKQWLIALKIPLLFSVVGVILLAIGGVSTSVTLLVIGLVVSVVAFVLDVIWQLFMYPRKFNKIYYTHVREKAEAHDWKADPSAGRTVAAIGIYCAISILLGVLLTFSTVSSLLFDNTSDDKGSYQSENTGEDYTEDNINSREDAAQSYMDKGVYLDSSETLYLDKPSYDSKTCTFKQSGTHYPNNYYLDGNDVIWLSFQSHLNSSDSTTTIWYPMPEFW